MQHQSGRSQPAFSVMAPALDNPSESMQSMRPPIWSWNVRWCRVWHLLENWLRPIAQDGTTLPTPLFFPDLEGLQAFHSLLGHWHIGSAARQSGRFVLGRPGVANWLQNDGSHLCLWATLGLFHCYLLASEFLVIWLDESLIYHGVGLALWRPTCLVVCCCVVYVICCSCTSEFPPVDK